MAKVTSGPAINFQTLLVLVTPRPRFHRAGGNGKQSAPRHDNKTKAVRKNAHGKRAIKTSRDPPGSLDVLPAPLLAASENDREEL